ncbi:MAG TPA: hypothetical protein VMH88_09655 [Gemmatimonadales bacterium]|nr:hypothetical protein [Gemmatimonadales bacterium]
MIVTLVCLATLGAAQPVDSQAAGRAIIQAMHDRYAGHWYRTLTFVQQNTRYFYPGDSVQHSVWFERASIPGKLRIDFRDGPGFIPGDGIVFASDTLFRMQSGAVKSATAFIHPLMVLGFDVYAQPVDQILAKLTTLGFDLATGHDDTWGGRAVYVVGAKAGDGRTRQFWVDKERLVFVRMLEPAQPDSTKISETQFNAYQKAGDGWVAAEVLFIADGKPVWKEQYSDIKTGVTVADAVFDPKQWNATK